MANADFDSGRQLPHRGERQSGDVALSIQKLGLGWLSIVVGQEQLETMLRSCTATELSLHSTDPKIRIASLFLLAHHWKGSSYSSPETMRQIAFSDPDPEVRASALTLFGHYYSATDDKNIGRFLAQIVSDSSQEDAFRRAAYCALVALTGTDTSSMEKLTNPRFDVTW